MIKTKAHQNHRLSSKVEPEDLPDLKFHMSIAMNRLEAMEREVVQKTAMSRQQFGAVPSVAKKLNIPEEKVIVIRRGALQKLRQFLVNAKFPEVTRRIYDVPALATI